MVEKFYEKGAKKRNFNNRMEFRKRSIQVITRKSMSIRAEIQITNRRHVDTNQPIADWLQQRRSHPDSCYYHDIKSVVRPPSLPINTTQEDHRGCQLTYNTLNGLVTSVSWAPISRFLSLFLRNSSADQNLINTPIALLHNIFSFLDLKELHSTLTINSCSFRLVRQYLSTDNPDNLGAFFLKYAQRKYFRYSGGQHALDGITTECTNRMNTITQRYERMHPGDPIPSAAWSVLQRSYEQLQEIFILTHDASFNIFCSSPYALLELLTVHPNLNIPVLYREANIRKMVSNDPIGLRIALIYSIQASLKETWETAMEPQLLELIQKNVFQISPAFNPKTQTEFLQILTEASNTAAWPSRYAKEISGLQALTTSSQQNQKRPSRQMLLHLMRSCFFQLCLYKYVAAGVVLSILGACLFDAGQSHEQ